MGKEQDYFSNLAYCWEFFEQDGLTDDLINQYARHISEPVLVVGSGQGLVSRRLIDLGFDVSSVDSIPEMAHRAKERRGVDTEVVDFISLERQDIFRTIIVNTGVITPHLIDELAQSFADSLVRNLNAEGSVILAMFERTQFDEFAEYIGIDSSLSLLSHLCRKIEEGNGIFEALQSSEVGESITKYHALRYRNELLEFEAQIKHAYRAYGQCNHTKPAHEWLPSVLRYVSYGISNARQTHLMNAIGVKGLDIVNVDKFNSVIIVRFKNGR